MEEEIKRNNLAINSMIKQVINIMKENNMSTVGTNGDEPVLLEPAKTILAMEYRKIIEIYKFEFPHCTNAQKEELFKKSRISLYKIDELDAHGSFGGVELASGVKKALDDIAQTLCYTIDNNGRIKYDRDGKPMSQFQNESQDTKSNIHLFSDDEVVENDVSWRDYFTYMSATQATDLDFYLDIIPHEIMHVLGFKGGLFEGATETFTRECALKYGIRVTSIAHQDETKLMQRVEKVIGRSFLSEAVIFNSQDDVERYQDISNAIDEKIEPNTKNQNLFERMYKVEKDFFRAVKSNEDYRDIKEIRKDIYVTLNTCLQEYIDESPEKLYKLGENSVPYTEDEQEYRKGQFSKIISMQDKEKEVLKYIIDNIGHNRNAQIDEQESQIQI